MKTDKVVVILCNGIPVFGKAIGVDVNGDIVAMCDSCGHYAIVPKEEVANYIDFVGSAKEGYGGQI